MDTNYGAITALRKALAEPAIKQDLTPEQPAQRKPLTDEEIAKAAYPFAWENLNTVEQRRAFARAIEAAHGIKE